MLAAIAGRYGTMLFGKIIPSVSVPEFCVALFAGYVIQWVLSRTGGQKYVDSASINRLSNLATDYLIVAGIASIKLPIVIQYAGPLAALFAAGIALVLFQAVWMGRGSSRTTGSRRACSATASTPAPWSTASCCCASSTPT